MIKKQPSSIKTQTLSIKEQLGQTLSQNDNAREQALSQYKSDFYRTQAVRAEKKAVQKRGSSFILGTEAAVLASQRPNMNTSKDL